MIPEHLARIGSKGARKDYARRIRNILGVSRDPAPNAIGALMAARELGKLLDSATAGRYGIAVYDFRTQQHLPPAEALTLVRGRLEADEHVPA